MTTMLAVRIHEFGGPEVLRIETLDRPTPKDDEVLIKVRAASVNPVDYKTRSGGYPLVTKQQLPRVLGRDVAGVVMNVGRAVQGVRTGDAVYALLDRDNGGYAEYVAIKAELACPQPKTLQAVDAAAVPLAAMTAWQGLFDHGKLEPNQTVLIHGGAGGVGHFAIQLAKAKGARVITTAGANDLGFVQELGADQAIDYKAQHFEEQVRDVDVVYDLIGGETQKRSWAVLKRGGRLVSTLGKPPEQEATKHGVQGIGYMAETKPAELREITALIEAGKVRVIVQATYPLAEAAAAQQRVEKEHTRGKVVLTVA
jgi:NADPH:quinone reductase-like Zn-dependent oxidoreductase